MENFLTSFFLIRPGGQWTVIEEEGHDGGPQRVRQRDHMHKGSNQLNYKNIGIENWPKWDVLNSSDVKLCLVRPWTFDPTWACLLEFFVLSKRSISITHLFPFLLFLLSKSVVLFFCKSIVITFILAAWIRICRPFQLTYHTCIHPSSFSATVLSLRRESGGSGSISTLVLMTTRVSSTRSSTLITTAIRVQNSDSKVNKLKMCEKT